MELADIIRWVDETNESYGNALFGNDFIDYEEIEVAPGEREKLTVMEKITGEYTPQYTKYSYDVIPYILQLGINDKKALTRRLFRNSRLFIHTCKQRRESSPEDWVYEIIFYNGGLISTNEEWFCNRTRLKIMELEYELLCFYCEVIHTCGECELNPEELHPDEDVIEVMKDILRSGIKSGLRITHKMECNYIKKSTTWQDYIIGKKRDAWIDLITRELELSKKKNGKLMATIILALSQTASIRFFKKSEFYRALRKNFPFLNSDEAINKYLNTNSANNLAVPIPQDEIEAMIKKISCD